MERISFTFDLDENKVLVKEALEWIKTQEEENNYMHNLKTACQQEYIDYSKWEFSAACFSPIIWESEKRWGKKKKQ